MKLRLEQVRMNESVPWLERVAAKVDEIEGVQRQELLSHLAWAKDQLRIVSKYSRICKRLEKFSRGLLAFPVHLVKFSFPVSLMPRTRLSIQEGVCQSFHLFCKELHLLTVTVASERLASADRESVVEMVKESSSRLWSTLAPMDGDLQAAKASLLTFLSNACVSQVEDEKVKLEQRNVQIGALRDALAKFSAKAPKKPPVKGRVSKHACLARKFVRGLHRRGHVAAFRTMITTVDRDWSKAEACYVRSIDEAFNSVKRSIDGDALNDDRCAEVFTALMSTRDALLELADTERDRLQWLLLQPSSASCWNSTFLCAEGVPLVPPRHLDLFASGPVGLSALPSTSSGELAGVRFARVLHDLVNRGYLPIDRMSSSYANSVAVLEFSKYEAAILQIEEEALIPLGENVNVAYVSSVPTLEDALKSQECL